MHIINKIAKTCFKCQQEKPISNFCKDKSRKDGLNYKCKNCDNKYSKKYYSEHKEESKQYSLENQEKISLRKKQYHLKHKVKDNLQFKRYYIKHKSNISLKHKEWRSKNKDKIRVQHRIYTANKRRTDNNFRILHILRVRINQVLNGYSKSSSTMKLIGCSLPEFIVHLQSHFKPGMTLANKGIRKWVLHHIKYCHTFDLKYPEQQRLCFHYTNMIPMWEDEHRALHAKNSV